MLSNLPTNKKSTIDARIPDINVNTSKSFGFKVPDRHETIRKIPSRKNGIIKRNVSRKKSRTLPRN